MSQHLISAIKIFAKREIVDYALMINGEWGSGKTYFLKNNLDQNLPEDSKVLYSSANGIVAFSEIIEQLKWQKIGLTSSKSALIGQWGKVITDVIPIETLGNLIAPGIGGILKSGKKKADALIEHFKKSDSFLFGRQDFIIIDDLERVDQGCDFIGLLGNINTEFTEHNGVKVLLVCDEDELRKRFSASDRTLEGTVEDYKNAKSKLVRRTYKYENDLATLIDPLIKSIVGDTDSNSPLFAEDNKKELVESLRICRKRNLRDIKFYIDNLHQVLTISQDHTKEDVFSYIARTLLVYSFDHKENPPTQEHEPKTEIPLAAFTSNTPGEYVESTEVRFNSAHPQLNRVLGNYFVRMTSLKNFSITGRLNEQDFKQDLTSLIESLNLDSEESKAIAALNHFRKIDKDSDFSAALEGAMNFLVEGTLTLSQCISFIRYNYYFITLNANPKFKTHSDLVQFVLDNIAKIILPTENDRFIRSDIRMLLSMSEPEYSQLKESLSKAVEENYTSNNQKEMQAHLDEVIKTQCFIPKNNQLQIFLSHFSIADLSLLIDLYLSSPLFRQEVLKEIDSLPHYKDKYTIDLSSHVHAFLTELKIRSDNTNHLQQLRIAELQSAFSDWKSELEIEGD